MKCFLPILTVTLLEVAVKGKLLGCYDANKLVRQLGDGKVTFEDNSPEKCREYCKDFKFYAVQDGDNCWCGNEQKHADKKADSECSTACPGSPDEKCGSKTRNNLYESDLEIPSPAPTEDEYLGCFADLVSLRRQLTGADYKFSDNSPDRCADFCREFRYYALQNKKFCFCGNEVHHKFGKNEGKDCSNECPGGGVTCGGLARNRLFQHPVALPTPDPTESDGNANQKCGGILKNSLFKN